MSYPFQPAVSIASASQKCPDEDDDDEDDDDDDDGSFVDLGEDEGEDDHQHGAASSSSRPGRVSKKGIPQKHGSRATRECSAQRIEARRKVHTSVCNHFFIPFQQEDDDQAHIHTMHPVFETILTRLSPTHPVAQGGISGVPFYDRDQGSGHSFVQAPHDPDKTHTICRDVFSAVSRAVKNRDFYVSPFDCIHGAVKSSRADRKDAYVVVYVRPPGASGKAKTAFREWRMSQIVVATLADDAEALVILNNRGDPMNHLCFYKRTNCVNGYHIFQSTARMNNLATTCVCRNQGHVL